MASEEETTLKGENNVEFVTTAEEVDLQTFYLTPDGLLKPVDDGDRESVKFCKAINLMKSSEHDNLLARKPIGTPKTSSRKNKGRPAKKFGEFDDEPAETLEQGDAIDPDFDADEAENTPVRPASRKNTPVAKVKSCSYCNKPFSERGLIKHIKNKHPDKVSEYAKTVPLELTHWMCPYCELFLYTKTKLTEHVKLSHSEKEDEFSVILDLDMSAENDEQAVIATKRKMDSNETAGDGDGDATPAKTKRRSEALQKSLNNSRAKKASRRSEYPKPCPDCGEIIDKSSRWFDHKKKHIPLEERKNHQCGYCDQMYTKRALEIHIKTMHPETVPEEQRQWECRFCDRVFRRTNTRHYHELSHKADGKKFPCDICNYAFINRSQLRKHYLTHSNTSVRCSKCRFLFENVDKLTAHCERVHPNDEVYGTINEVKERSTPIQRTPKNTVRPVTKTPNDKPLVFAEFEVSGFEYESDDSNEANAMYERSLLKKQVETESEGEKNTDDVTGEAEPKAADVELFRCKLCNVFYRKKAALAEHCLEFHNDMMEKLVLAGL